MTIFAVGNRTRMTQQHQNPALAGLIAPQLDYVYDPLYRLTQATRPLAGQANETFTYDALGNRIRRDGQGQDARLDTGNRLLEDAAFVYEYDNNGNMISRRNKANGEVTRYTYDAENQLTRIDFPAGGFAEYKYDALGRRIEKNVRGTITRYIYDQEDIILEYNGNNQLVARYTHGAGIDEPLLMERDVNANGQFGADERFYYHTDGLGSVVDLTNNVGAVAQSYVYDSFGNIVRREGNVVNPYTYTGREIDEESGLYHLRARQYDPQIGRFLQEDPLEYSDSMNLYEYAESSPLNFVDLWGEDVIGVGGTIPIGPINFPVGLPSPGVNMPNIDLDIQPPSIGPQQVQASSQGNQSGSKDCAGAVVQQGQGPYGSDLLSSKKDEGQGTKRGGKKEEKEKKTRRNTIREHWRKYRNPRDVYEKGDMRKQLRKMIKEFRKFFPKKPGYR